MKKSLLPKGKGMAGIDRFKGFRVLIPVQNMGAFFSKIWLGSGFILYHLVAILETKTN